MASADQIADARQSALIAVSNVATARGLKLWRNMDYNALDASWERVAPALVAQSVQAQARSVSGADGFTSAISKEYDFEPEVAHIVPQAFVGVDGSGRPLESLLHGAVTTTKEAVGSGFGARQAMEAGANYLALMIKTALADVGRSADMTSSIGKGYTKYVRVVEPGACSRCIVLAGADQFKPFKRHPACKCTCQPVPYDGVSIPTERTPSGVFDAMSDADQDRAFGRAGAQAIRDGADIGKVQSARRGAAGIGYSHRMPTGGQWNRMRKTTIGRRPDGTPVQVYSTTEGATARGAFGRQQRATSESQRLAGARYSSTKRVRLMPESIMEFAGDNTELRKAFLRDAGYLEYRPAGGYDRGNKWIAEIEQMRVADRKLVNKATLAYGNFTLG